MAIKNYPIRHYIIASLFVFLSYSTLILQDTLKRHSNEVTRSSISFEKESGETQSVTKEKRTIDKILTIQRSNLKQFQNLYIQISIICFIYLIVLFTIKEMPLTIRFLIAMAIIYMLIFHHSGIKY